MADINLKKLSRAELLEMMIKFSEESEQAAAHEKQLEQLALLHGKGQIGHASGHVGLAGAVGAAGDVHAVQIHGHTHDLILDLLHGVEGAENRLCGTAQLLSDGTGVYGGQPLLARKLEGGSEQIGFGKLYLWRHGVTSLNWSVV